MRRVGGEEDNFSKRAVSRYNADGGTGGEALVGLDLRPVRVKAL